MVEPGSKQRLHEAMARAGMSTADLLEATGMDSHTLYRYLNDGLGRCIRVDNIARLAKALDVSPRWLITGKKGVWTNAY